jgi:PAS domain S-box-containing protein
LAAAVESPPDLVLINLQTGRSGGFEVCRKLKTHHRTRNIPVILISSSEDIAERLQGLALGAVDVVPASVRSDELRARVQTHLERELQRCELERMFKQSSAALRNVLAKLQAEVVEKRRVETALRENSELTLLAMQVGRVYAFEWNPTTDEIKRSYNCANLLHVAGDATRDTWSECVKRIHADDQGEVTRRIQTLTPAADICECNYRVVGCDGKIVYLHAVIRGLFDSLGRPVRYIGIVADMTRAREAEAALHESEFRFRHLADTAPFMICASGADKLATYFNKAWLIFTGQSLDHELGYGWMSGLHPEDRSRTIAAYEASFDVQRNCHLEYRLRRADGEYRWIVCSGVPRWSADGAFAGYIASCIDRTDLKRAQEEAFDKQKLESLRLLTGGIAHDFNNLLGGILAQAEIAETDVQEGGSPLEAIRNIRDVASRAAEIVRELMIYSGQDKATLEPVNISRVVEEMAELLKVSISKHAILQTDLAGNLPAVLGNTTQLRQVVMNLIINASDAIGVQSGTIQVGTSKVTVWEAPGAAVPSPPEGDYVRIEVSDSGCGMSEEAVSRIFDPFFTTKPAGHGLGLAVVQGIVRSHGGVVNVKSAPGRGTSFDVYLPCANDLALRPPASVSRPSLVKVGSGATVLIVEKDDHLRISVAKALRRRGFAVVSAPDGQAALDALNERLDVDVAVVDLTPSGGFGLEAVKQIRMLGRSVPVILTSDDRDGSAAASGPGISFVQKPYRIAELVERLEESVQRAAAHKAQY